MRHPTYLFGIAFALLTVGLVLPFLRAFAVPPGSDPGPRAVVFSAWIAAGYWYVGVILLLADRDEAYPSGWSRVWWATGCGLALLHTALAFHVAHGWSHAAAFAHTERVGGVGAGVYVNYLFLAVWAADAAWSWVWPRGYYRRPRGVTWAVHGFLAFVVFNATVVFASGVVRWVAGAAFALAAWDLADGWWRGRADEKTRPGAG